VLKEKLGIMKERSISLKAYRCPQTGRDIHYSFAHLRGGKKPSSSSPPEFSSSNDANNSNNDTIIGPSAACWIFSYPAGPNRRLLEGVISRYTPEFECDRDVFFICLNRPGKGGTSSSSSSTNTDAANNNIISPEQEYIRTACNDIITIIDYYQVPKVSLFYMCAGSTFAYSFAKLHPERTTGYILGLSSWVLRHDGTKRSTNDDDCVDCTTPPNMNSLIHSWAMHGYFGPKSIISSLAGGFMGSVPGLFNSFPQQWVVNGFKKELSNGERMEFDERYPEDGGVAFVEGLTWSYEDGDGDGSVFVNVDANDVENKHVPNTNDGSAKDIAVCLSTQQDLGMEYKYSVPKQKRILLWHGENDKMVNVAGAEYLEAMLSNATLSYVSEGTHQGTMFFFPRDLMLELNQISNNLK
jgi:pimeloyl-ACP methyl ester carboxylesterase